MQAGAPQDSSLTTDGARTVSETCFLNNNSNTRRLTGCSLGPNTLFLCCHFCISQFNTTRMGRHRNCFWLNSSRHTNYFCVNSSCFSGVPISVHSFPTASAGRMLTGILCTRQSFRHTLYTSRNWAWHRHSQHKPLLTEPHGIQKTSK